MFVYNGKNYFTAYEITRYMNLGTDEDFKKLNNLFHVTYEKSPLIELTAHYVTQKLYAAIKHNLISYVSFKKKTDIIYYGFTIESVRKFLESYRSRNIMSEGVKIIKEVEVEYN